MLQVQTTARGAEMSVTIQSDSTTLAVGILLLLLLNKLA